MSCRSRLISISSSPGAVLDRHHDSRLLARPEFEDQQAIGVERRNGFGNQPMNDAQAVVSGKQGGGRLELSDFGLQHRRVAGWNIRGIRNDAVEMTGHAAQEVGLDAAYAR